MEILLKNRMAIWAAAALTIALLTDSGLHDEDIGARSTAPAGGASSQPWSNVTFLSITSGSARWTAW